jgi:hypothetical protein
MLIVQLFIVLDVLKCQELLEGGNWTFVLSFVSTMLNIFSFFMLKRLDQNATGESFIMLSLEGMTALISWLPHQNKLKDESKKTLCIDYGVI